MQGLGALKRKKKKTKNPTQHPPLTPPSTAEWGIDTWLINGDKEVEDYLPDVAPPIRVSTTYKTSNPQDLIYSRAHHPTRERAEALIGKLEGGKACLFSSGLSAINGLLVALKPKKIILCKGYKGTISAIELYASVSGCKLVSQDFQSPFYLSVDDPDADPNFPDDPVEITHGKEKKEKSEKGKEKEDNKETGKKKGNAKKETDEQINKKKEKNNATTELKKKADGGNNNQDIHEKKKVKNKASDEKKKGRNNTSGEQHNKKEDTKQKHQKTGTCDEVDESLPGTGLLDQKDSEFWDSISEGDLIYLETPMNPLNIMQNIQLISQMAKSRKAIVSVDSTFATPILQKPLQLGADFVIHSCTKYLGGHSDLLGGVVVARSSLDWYKLNNIRTTIGSVPGNLESFLLVRSLRTLNLRVQKQSSNALELAKFLEKQDQVLKVWNAGLESHSGHELAKRQLAAPHSPPCFAFQLKEASHMDTFSKNLKLFVDCTSLGGVESTIECRDNPLSGKCLRISTGIENVDDLIDDLKHALDCL